MGSVKRRRLTKLLAHHNSTIHYCIILTRGHSPWDTCCWTHSWHSWDIGRGPGPNIPRSYTARHTPSPLVCSPRLSCCSAEASRALRTSWSASSPRLARNTAPCSPVSQCSLSVSSLATSVPATSATSSLCTVTQSTPSEFFLQSLPSFCNKV